LADLRFRECADDALLSPGLRWQPRSWGNGRQSMDNFRMSIHRALSSRTCSRFSQHGVKSWCPNLKKRFACCRNPAKCSATVLYRSCFENRGEHEKSRKKKPKKCEHDSRQCARHPPHIVAQPGGDSSVLRMQQDAAGGEQRPIFASCGSRAGARPGTSQQRRSSCGSGRPTDSSGRSCSSPASPSSSAHAQA